MRTFDYLQRAEDCARWAKEASNENARKIWRNMELYWRKRGGDPHYREVQQAMDGLFTVVEGPDETLTLRLSSGDAVRANDRRVRNGIF